MDAITDSGRQEMRDWLRQIVEEPRHEYPHFVAALSLIAALPGRNRRIAHQAGRPPRRRERRDTQAHRQTLTSGVHPLFLVEEDYRLALLDAEAAFIEGFIERITHPQTGWAPQWREFHGAQRVTQEGQEP